MVDEGYARLPGAGYEALHPELKGINPEDYPDIAKMRILADVAPYSRQYQKYSSIIRNQTRDNPELEEEYERILEHVRKTKESTLQVAKRHFNAPVDTIEGTVKSAGAQGVELEEYPGRVFHFSAVSSSMAENNLVPPRRRIKFSPARAGKAGTPAQAGFPACSRVCRPGPALPARPGPRAASIYTRVPQYPKFMRLPCFLSGLEVWFYGFRGWLLFMRRQLM